MKRFEINRAYNVLYEMNKWIMPVRTAYAVCILRRNLRPLYQENECAERKLLDECGGKMEDSGAILFKKEEDAELFRARMSELLNEDRYVAEHIVEISIDALGDNQLSPEQIEALEGFVEFK